jgi:hypothetical protein
VIAQSDNLANDGFGTAHWSECGADETLPRASPSLATGYMERSHRPLRGLCQRNRKHGALPRDCGPGDWHKNVELSSQLFLSRNTASDGDRKRPAELGCAVSDLLMESITFGGRLAADEQQSVTLFRLGVDRLFARLLDPRGSLDRITRRLLGPGVVAFSSVLVMRPTAQIRLERPLFRQGRCGR